MRSYPCAALGLSLAAVLLFLGNARADDKKKADDQKKQPDLQRLQFGLGRAGGPLLPEGTKDKLNLSAEQKDKVAKLEKEFEEKSKANTDKVRETMRKAIQDRDVAGLQNLREVMEANQKLRGDYEGKVAALLSDEQKKKYDEAKRDARRGGGPQPPFGRRPAEDKGLLPPDVQDKLSLSKEQKDKLADLQKEYEKKAMEVLTEEQKKKYEELKKESPRPTFPRRPGGG